MRWILLCSMLAACSKPSPEPEGTYCLLDDIQDPDCRSYRECKIISKGSGTECLPLEEAMGQRVAYCYQEDFEQGEGLQVNCFIGMSECRGMERMAAKGFLGAHLIKPCYVVTP